MGTLKKIIISALVFIATFGTMYLLTAFVHMDIDAAHWDSESRAILSVFGFIFSIAAYSATFINLSEF